jgi:hypothetical protein
MFWADEICLRNNVWEWCALFYRYVPNMSNEMPVVEIVWAEACVCDISVVKFTFDTWPSLRVGCYFSRDKLKEILFLGCETWLLS